MRLRGLLVHFRAIMFNLVLLSSTITKSKILAGLTETEISNSNICLMLVNFTVFNQFFLNRTVSFA